MKNFINVFFVGLLFLSANTSVFATSPIPVPPGTQPIPFIPRGIGFQIGGNGSEISLTVDTFRQIIGHAIGSGVIDNFVVHVKEPNGGLIACAGNPIPNDPVTPPNPGLQTGLDILLDQLRSIQPEQDVLIFVDLVESCDNFN